MRRHEFTDAQWRKTETAGLPGSAMVRSCARQHARASRAVNGADRDAGEQSLDLG